MRTVLWDVDGTLLRNSRRAGALYDEAIEAVTGIAPTGLQPNEHGKTDAQIIQERLDANGADPHLRRAVQARLDEISVAGNTGPFARELAPGVAAALTRVSDAGWRNGLLTGNSAARARAKLVGAGLAPAHFDWRHSYFGDESLRRSDLTLTAALDLQGGTVVVIGDTPADGEAAASAGFPFIAVATGAFAADTLRLTCAIAVLTDLECGLEPLLETLAGLV